MKLTAVVLGGDRAQDRNIKSDQHGPKQGEAR